MKTKKLTRLALLTTVALTIFMVEAQIPAPVPIPGVKLGLANIITVYAVFALGGREALWILLGRIILGSIFSGQIMSLIYSLSGGILCYLTMLGMRRLVTGKQIWALSIMGAIAHNIGQILAAMFVMGSAAVLYYLPILMVSGIITGLFTGLCAQIVINRLPKKE